MSKMIFAYEPEPPTWGSVRWYLNRLRAMSMAEIRYRVHTTARQVVMAHARHMGLGGADAAAPPARLHRPLFALHPPPMWISAPSQLDDDARARVIGGADILVAGQWQRLDGITQTLTLPDDWQQGIDTQGDDLRLWMELHRHSHLVVLAQALTLTGAPAYLETLKQHLSSWLQSCPKGRGIAWSTALDVALRLLNWSVVWQLLLQHAKAGQNGTEQVPVLRDVLGAELTDAWLASIPLHVHAIRGNLSRHSSANNHLMGELVGMLVADASWPYWGQHQRWADQAWRELCQACLAQVAPDGVNREQASWYLGFVFELLTVGLCIARAQDRSVPQVYLERMASMARFAQALCDRAGNPLHHGDADDAHAIGLVSGEHDALHRMLHLAGTMQLGGWRLPLSKPAVLRGIGAWFTPIKHPHAASVDEVARLKPQLPRRFEEGGYYFLGQRFGQPDEIKLIADAGELGYLSIAAHGHADALSLRLSVAGHPMLVDRGSGHYNTEPQWRQYLRRTLAHNTLCLDGQDQSVYGGPFLWLDKARAQLTLFDSNDDKGVFRASHDGYLRLPGQPIHSREVQWDGAQRRFTVRDAVTSRSEHEAVIAWHFSPACTVVLHEERVAVRCGPVTLTIQAQALQAGAWSLHLADAESPLGWHSPAFGQRVSAPTLLWRTHVAGNLLVDTILDIHIES
jgi:hypothetical protein